MVLSYLYSAKSLYIYVKYSEQTALDLDEKIIYKNNDAFGNNAAL